MFLEVPSICALLPSRSITMMRVEATGCLFYKALTKGSAS